MRILILGCGYVGQPLAKELIELDYEVHAARRSPLSIEGAKTHQVDITQRDSFEFLPRNFDWIIFCASSGRGNAEAHRSVFVDGINNLIDWVGETSARILFTSSTNIYPHTNGNWVDENTPQQPVAGTAQNLVDAETALMQSGITCSILRVAGIYGPDRGYFYRQLLNNEAVVTDKGKRWMNMIHRDDVVGAILAAMKIQPGVYNACDDKPVTQGEFYEWLTNRLGKPMPPEGEVTNQKRATTSKRVSNKKLKAAGWTLNYPTFREGYETLITG